MDWIKYANDVYDFLPDTAKELIRNDPEKAVFCRDGIIDEGVFGEATLDGKPFRPLFILRECHDKNGCTGCEDVTPSKKCKNHGENNTNNMHWIDFTKCKLGYPQKEGTTGKLLNYESIIEKRLQVVPAEENDILKRVAIINLKKMSGGGTTSSAKSQNTLCYSCHARKFATEIKEQIEGIKPTLIICGGTFGEVKNILGKTEEINSQNKSCKVYKMSFQGEDIFVLDTYHPNQWRIKAEDIEASLNSACDIIKGYNHK